MCCTMLPQRQVFIGLTTSIAKEGAHYGINVNVIPVPTTDTPGLREADFELVADEIR